MALPARTMRGALTAAHNKGITAMSVTLVTNEKITFMLEEVIDDALIGQSLGKVMVVPYHAIASIELG